MSLTRDKILVSVTVQIQANTVDIAWASRILEDGVVIHSTPERGAYPLDENGEPIGLSTPLGATLSQLLTSAGASAQSQLAEISADLQAALALIEQKDSAIAEHQALIAELQEQIIAQE